VAQFTLRLQFNLGEAPVIHGIDGVSQKADLRRLRVAYI